MLKVSGNAADKSGFTLIEIIIALVLLVIIVLVAGLGLIKGSQGYVFAQQNSHTVQTAQIAMARMVKELGSCSAINSLTATSVNYTVDYLNGNGAVNSTITLSGSTVQINGNTLIDNVTASALTCYDAGGNQTLAAANVRRVDFTFTVNGADNMPSTFTNSICILESY
jgi:prepilin-type N-terminal cleavage/methylation domain-containing protein